MSFKPKDHYYHKAKKENFLARSIYKLEEIDQRFRLLKKGQKVLDLGAAPGSWSQYVSSKIGSHGYLIGIDLQPVSFSAPNSCFLIGDCLLDDFFSDPHFLETEKEKYKELWMKAGILNENHQIIYNNFDVLLSDMAPRTTGIKSVDQAKSYELCQRVLELSKNLLKPHGHLVMKLFHSEEYQSLKKEIQTQFKRFESIKPESTRKISKEIFIVGIDHQLPKK